VSEKLPSREEAIQILVKSGCSKHVINHIKAVAKLAVEISKECERRNLKVNVQLVEIGALLHDIGRSKTHSVHHAVIGAEIAKSLGLHESLILIIERHVGGGITLQEAKELGWPPKDYLPQTLEEKIVCYADKLIEGVKRVSIEFAIRKLAKELGDNHPAIERVRKLHEEFAFILGDRAW
jgi:uncharacterized protein